MKRERMDDSAARFAKGVRILGFVSAVLMIIAVAEARALRTLRAELQQLRSGCGQVLR